MSLQFCSWLSPTTRAKQSEERRATMKRKGVLPLVTISAVLCLAGTDRGGAEVNQTSDGPQPARLYIRLLGTSH
jgi:hypothetical protein